MEPQNEGAFNYSMQEFSDLFCSLTGAINPNDMMVEIRGFRVFAWLPIFWPQIYKFPLHPDDLIIATFPKCGTTWMQHMAHLILTEDFEAGQSVPIDVRAPFIEFPSPPKPSTLTELAQRPPPRILKTHLPACLLPKDAPKCRVISVYRNAKDVVVSFYHHYLRLHPKDQSCTKTFEEFVQDFLNGQVAFGPYPAHLKGYLDYQKKGNTILMIRYEDMKKDTRKVIHQVAGFLGKTLEDETVEKIYEATTIESMRENRATNYTKMKNPDAPADGPQFLRKGIVGDWRNYFTDPELGTRVEEFIKANIPDELICPDSL